jgi:hypothetical protein
MKKWIISAGILCHLLSAKAQDSLTVGKVLFEEANFVSSYYSQDGNKSAVTGGIGSEKLSDIGGSLNVSFSLLDKRLKNTLPLLLIKSIPLRSPQPRVQMYTSIPLPRGTEKTKKRVILLE